VKQWRDAPDQFQPEERREKKDVGAQFVDLHKLFPPKQFVAGRYGAPRFAGRLF
jgi:hypothetical protein